ncbi:MAG TPA: DUF1494 domain-containing protein [Chlamydiales bacterium]|nr:DUF1494 domain-containing protein [Chlamydiales bacterium]
MDEKHVFWVLLSQCAIKKAAKRTVFLLEILIGLFLISILVSCLFTSMAKSAFFEKKIEFTRNAILERQHLQTYLQDLFLSQYSMYTKKLGNEKNKSLIAVFDHGIDPDPAFSGSVLARLYVDDERNLALAIWPMEKKEKTRLWRKINLLPQVETFQILFLGSKTRDSAFPVNEELAWNNDWPKERQESPLMIRLLIKQKEGSISYAFFTSAVSLVSYQQKGTVSQ